MIQVIPTVHLNGTSKDELQRQLADAVNALEAAMTALVDAAPNARDYYPQGPEAFAAAVTAHEDRARRLQSVWEELLAVYTAIEERYP